MATSKFSFSRNMYFADDITDDNGDYTFSVTISGHHYYDEGDYWNPPYSDVCVEEVVLNDDVSIDGNVYKAGTSLLSSDFLDMYAEDPNYFENFDVEDIEEDSYIFYEPDYDLIGKYANDF